jgi:hypothetical protein
MRMEASFPLSRWSVTMMKFKAIELLTISYLLAVCRHAWIMTMMKFKATADVEPLDPELDSDTQAIDEGLIFCHIACCMEI